MKGSAITGPVGKEAAELWPVCPYPIDWLGRKKLMLMGYYSVSLPTPVSSCKSKSNDIEGWKANKGLRRIGYQPGRDNSLGCI